MSDISQVVAQMTAVGMPPLPPNHPILDGKYKRFGPQKKAWYILREMTLKSGRNVVTGAFGIFQGEQRNTVPVTIDFADMSNEDKAELSRKQKEYEAKEAQSKQKAADLAANRATDQWSRAAGNPVAHPYLARKQITAECVRIGGDGLLLVPMVRAGKLVGLQKIDAAGDKRYNAGMDKIGAACVLGTPAGAAVIGIGEGYATCRSVRMAHDIPVVSAFDAGNILPVALDVRRDHPDTHILFLADDDHLLQQRFIDRLRDDFSVSVEVPIDGATHVVIADDGEQAQATATWCTDPQGVAFIEADVRKGRLIRTLKFQNAGIAHCKAAARAVGNASVVWPVFTDRGLNKWSDWNDLHKEQSLDDVRLQIAAALAAPVDSPAPSDATADDGALPPWLDADQTDVVDTNSPAPLGLAAAPEVLGLVALEWALAHCSLVQGSTNVWDSVNKLNMKRPAFVALVGKESASLWEAHKERRTISPRNLPKTVRGVAAATGGAGDENLVMMLDRYTLLYGTKTVWDADKRMVLSYDAMALARSGDLATRWIGHPLHREIDAGNLVFDPTQKLSLDTHVNMFQGLPLKPARDDAKSGLVLELLHSLCSGESNGDDVLHWVVQWLAYPLQNPGAKMQTGLLFFGERQGTGKSLFFEGIMRPIYGDHGVTVGQHQLDSTFTGWKSQKLYILFEEILSRADKYSHFGLVKHMITGGDTPINEKNLPTRFEANHANTVMLSNEFQAVPIEPDDRRFMVVEARNPLSPDVLAGLTDGDRVADGVSAAFYDFLMRYPLDGFKAHAKPLMTASKQRMIRFGLPSWDAFYQAWSGAELNAPFCTCLATDLYLVYDRWCSKGNERAITQTKFSELMATRVHRSRQKIYLGGADKQLLTVFKVPSEEEETPSKACQRFRDQADIKDRV